MAVSLLARSAKGATFLILLQVASRALTFIVNQVLLRFLSPRILGVATQLELLSISTLYFSRESIRVSVQRQRGDIQQGPDDKPPESTNASNSGAKTARRIQEVVNLSWAAVGLGLILTGGFGWLYLRKADSGVLETPRIIASLCIYGLATIIELFNEPCFAVAQQQMLYSTRASAEMQATLTRCIITCSTAIYASRSRLDLGVLPFAFGQLSYAIVLTLGYLYRVSPVCRATDISIAPTIIQQTREFIPRPLLHLAYNLYGQSLFKQLLTSGDQYLIASLTSLSSQGAYALASNYGGLLARILFQPIEESSRSLFARLVPPRSSTISKDHTGTRDAAAYLTRLLRAYLLLSLFALTIGPPFSRPLLHLVAGARWSTTEAPSVLASYCYYIPILALNGLLEAFVAAVATPSQLRQQSLWMVGFSGLFAVMGIIILGKLEMGARGLVFVNCVTMAGRVCWSWIFVNRELQLRGERLNIGKLLPFPGSTAAGVGATAVLDSLDLVDGGMGELAKGLGIVGACGLVILYFERQFFLECYQMLRPSQVPNGVASKPESKF